MELPVFAGTARINGSASKRLEAHPLPELQSLRIREAPAERLAENGAGAAESTGTTEQAHQDGCEANGNAGDALAVLSAKARLYPTANATGKWVYCCIHVFRLPTAPRAMLCVGVSHPWSLVS